MNSFNASAWALEHKSFVGFLMVLLSVAGLFSYKHLGRDRRATNQLLAILLHAVFSSFIDKYRPDAEKSCDL